MTDSTSLSQAINSSQTATTTASSSSNSQVYPVVSMLHQLADIYSIKLTAEWLPREHRDMEATDRLSKARGSDEADVIAYLRAAVNAVRGPFAHLADAIARAEATLSVSAAASSPAAGAPAVRPAKVLVVPVPAKRAAAELTRQKSRQKRVHGNEGWQPKPSTAAEQSPTWGAVEPRQADAPAAAATGLPGVAGTRVAIAAAASTLPTGAGPSAEVPVKAPDAPAASDAQQSGRNAAGLRFGESVGAATVLSLGTQIISNPRATQPHKQRPEEPSAGPTNLGRRRRQRPTPQSDPCDWRLSDAVYQHLCAHPVLQGRKPTLDVFASHLNTKVPGRFYSWIDCPGSLGVDAFQHPWAVIGGERQLAFIHINVAAQERVADRIAKERVDCIWLVPLRLKGHLLDRFTGVVKARVPLLEFGTVSSPNNGPWALDMIAAYILWDTQGVGPRWGGESMASHSAALPSPAAAHTVQSSNSMASTLQGSRSTKQPSAGQSDTSKARPGL